MPDGSGVSLYQLRGLDGTVRGVIGLPPDPDAGIGLELVRLRIEGADLRGLDLSGAAGPQRRGALAVLGLSAKPFSLRGADLSGVDLSGSDLRGADLEGATLRGTVLEGCRLDGANLHRARLFGAHLVGSSCRGATFQSADLQRAALGGCDCEGADFHGARGDGASFRAANLTGCSFHGASLVGADLREAAADRTAWHEAALRSARLNLASLRRARLSSASMTGASLRGADLVDAVLSDAEMKGAGLRGADLTRASLTGCRLAGADLTGVRLPESVWERCGLEDVRWGGPHADADPDGDPSAGARFTGCTFTPARTREGDLDFPPGAEALRSAARAEARRRRLAQAAVYVGAPAVGCLGSLLLIPAVAVGGVWGFVLIVLSGAFLWPSLALLDHGKMTAASLLGMAAVWASLWYAGAGISEVYSTWTVLLAGFLSLLPAMAVGVAARLLLAGGRPLPDGV